MITYEIENHRLCVSEGTSRNSAEIKLCFLDSERRTAGPSSTRIGQYLLCRALEYIGSLMSRSLIARVMNCEVVWTKQELLDLRVAPLLILVYVVGSTYNLTT